VDVIGHEAVAQDRYSILQTAVGELLEEEAAIDVAAENGLPVIPALGDVIRDVVVKYAV
jgi:hypothetical protein